MYLELRPVFRDPRPTTTPTTTTTKNSTTTTTTKVNYDRRRRNIFPTPPPDVRTWCEIRLRFAPCDVYIMCVVNPCWECVKICSVGDGSNSVSSIDYKIKKVAPSKPGVAALEAEGDSGRSYHEVRVPSSFIFNTPELRSLLSDEEKQRLQQFIDSTKPKHPVPPNIVVIDGDCPESLPYTIGGGCRCKDAVFGCPWTPNSYLLNGRWSCSDLPVGGALRIEVERQKPMSICSDTFRSPRVIGMDGVMALGVKATCTEGTLIGGSCAYKSSYSNLGWLASFPVDASTFMCLGRGDTGQSPEIEVTALAYCLELWAIQNVITVQRYGLDTASAKCPDGYRVVGGGCSYEDGNDFHLDQSYPTTQNTWECVFSSTDSCGEGSPHCLLSVAYALCLGN